MATWKIIQIEILNSEEDQNPAGWVLNIHYDCTQDGGRVYGSLSMPAREEGGVFTDLAAMSVEDRIAKALDWLAEQLGEDEVARIEASVAAMAEAILNPRTSSLKLVHDAAA